MAFAANGETAGQRHTSSGTKGEREKHNRSTEKDKKRLTGRYSHIDMERVRGSAKDRELQLKMRTAENELVGGKREEELAEDSSVPVEEIKGLHPA